VILGRPEDRGPEQRVRFHDATRTNTVLYVRSRTAEVAPHEAPLSIHCAFRGTELYESDDARFAVGGSGGFLVLNPGRRVWTSVAEGPPLESMSVLFDREFAQDVLRSPAASADHLLDPSGDAAREPAFFERVYAADAFVSPRLAELRARLASGRATPGWLEETFHQLLDGLARADRALAIERALVPALRPATREELFRRLHRAKDYIDASLAEPLTVPRMAAVACIAPHRFIRLYKATFGVTPHQYLSAKRLEAARALIVQTDRPVTDIALAVGFESLGSFSWLFRKRFGASPLQLRIQVRSRR
jgi:AraC-like DNA-binding protein